MRPLLLVVLALAAGCLEHSENAWWSFTCQGYDEAETPDGGTIVTPTRAPPLDEAEVRASMPVLARALDECAEDGGADVRGKDALRADAVLGGRGAFTWADARVSATRVA